MTLIKRKTNGDLPEVFSRRDPWDELFGRFFAPTRMAPRSLWDESTVLAPPVEVNETESEVIVSTELPGMKRDEVEVTIHDDTLTIRGEKKDTTERKEGKYRYTERRFGQFVRTVQLPTLVNTEKVKAKFDDGVLEVRMPIADNAKPRRIEIAAK